MQYDKYGFLSPNIIKNSCVQCHLCEKTCPIISPKRRDNHEQPRVFSSIVSDAGIRQESTSGGAFWSFASYVISKGGVVFGVIIEGTHVRHSYTETLENLHAFMGSKYVQSEIGDSYKEVKSFLKKDRIVMFTGTPCQVAGLRCFLQKDYSNLLTIELLCRGVPSPRVWEKYINEKLIKLRGHEIKDIRFRTKSPQYTSPVFSYVLRFSYLDETNCWKEFWEDCIRNPFFSYFLHHNFRSSCYQCQFRNPYSSGADITIGDAISDSRFGAEGDNNVSTIVIHTPKGEEALCHINNQIQVEEVELSVLEKSFRSSTEIAYRDRLLRPWKLSNRLALMFPLENVRRIYEYTPYSIRSFNFLKRLIKRQTL